MLLYHCVHMKVEEELEETIGNASAWTFTNLAEELQQVAEHKELVKEMTGRLVIEGGVDMKQHSSLTHGDTMLLTEKVTNVNKDGTVNVLLALVPSKTPKY